MTFCPEPETPDNPVRRRHFLAVLGVAACSSTPATSACTPTPPDNDGGSDGGSDGGPDAAPELDVMGDVTGGEGPPPPVDASAACMTAGVRVATLSDIAVGSYRLIQQRPSILVILGRDARGLYAYSARCTHTGCTVPAPANAMALSSCPCHFSRFDAHGVVQPGSMARTDLEHYAVALCEGGVYVDRTRVVAGNVRAPVTG